MLEQSAARHRARGGRQGMPTLAFGCKVLKLQVQCEALIRVTGTVEIRSQSLVPAPLALCRSGRWYPSVQRSRSGFLVQQDGRPASRYEVVNVPDAHEF